MPPVTLLSPQSLAGSHDAIAATIVIGGTLLATLLRAGPREAMRTLRMLFASWRGGFDADAMRARLSPQVQQFNMDGLVRARPQPTGDAEIDTALAALVAHRSVEAMQAAHLAGRDRRLALASSGVRVLAQASELAPVAGLGGTLVALTQLPTGIAHGAAMGAIGMAVHATLMGLVFAHIVLVPLAASAERYALALEAGRSEIVDWLAGQLAHAGPGGQRGRMAAEAAHRGPVETIEPHPRPHRPAPGAPEPALAETPVDPILAEPQPTDAVWAAAVLSAQWPAPADAEAPDPAPAVPADPAPEAMAALAPIVAPVPAPAPPRASVVPPPRIMPTPVPARDSAATAPWLTPYLAPRAPAGDRV